MGNSFDKFAFTGGNPGHIWERHRHRALPAQQNQNQQCSGEHHHFRQQPPANSQTRKVPSCGCTTKTLPHGNSTPNLGGSYISLTTTVNKRSVKICFNCRRN